MSTPRQGMQAHLTRLLAPEIYEVRFFNEPVGDIDPETGQPWKAYDAIVNLSIKDGIGEFSGLEDFERPIAVLAAFKKMAALELKHVHTFEWTRWLPEKDNPKIFKKHKRVFKVADHMSTATDDSNWPYSIEYFGGRLTQESKTSPRHFRCDEQPKRFPENMPKHRWLHIGTHDDFFSYMESPLEWEEVGLPATNSPEDAIARAREIQGRKPIDVFTPEGAAEFARTGERRQFGTGAHRDANNDKGRMDLLPWLSVIRNSKHFQKGAKTHGERNWEKGIPISVLLDSAARHLGKALAGMTDENHIDACHWNISCAVETLERIKLGTMDAKLNDVKGLT